MLKENGGCDSLSYLTDFLDSAQENFPHLWVNGEKYVFSDDVLQAGTNIHNDFLTLKKIVNDLIDQINDEDHQF